MGMASRLAGSAAANSTASHAGAAPLAHIAIQGCRSLPHSWQCNMYLPQAGCKTSTHRCKPPPAAHRSGCVHSRARHSPGAWRQGTRAAPPRGPAGRSGRRAAAGRSPFVRAWLDRAPARPSSMHLWLLPAGTFHPCWHLSPAAPAPPPTPPGAPSRRGMWPADPPGTRPVTAGPFPPAAAKEQSGFRPDQEARSREGRRLAWRYPCRSGEGQLLAPHTSLTRSGCRSVQVISLRTPIGGSRW